MARLARVHFAGLGTDSARFNPVTLDFCDPQGRAGHAVMWLRNGGGKTTMLSFLYSTLRPHSNDWLGRHNGRQTDLLEYVKEKQTAFVLLEFEFPTGVRRVVGQTISKRSAREPKRWFFTFRTDRTLAWDKIPVIGLGDAAGSIELFMDRMQAIGNQPESGLEFYRTDRQGDWRAHLDSIGLDPEIYHTHLLMNADEGGLLNFFDFQSAETFIEKLLDMAFETMQPSDEGSDRLEKEDLTGVIEKFRQKVFARPNLDATAGFCQHSLAALEALKTELDVAAQFRQQRENYQGQANRLLLSVDHHLEKLRAEVTQLEKEKGISAEAKKEAIRRRDEHRKFQKHYDRRRRLLAIDEAKRSLVNAEETRTREETWLAALKAAHRSRRIGDCERLIADFSRQKKELEKAHEPDRKALEGLGRRISDLLGERISELGSQISRFNQSRSQSLTDQKNWLEKLLQVGRDLSGANNSLAAVRTFLNEVDQERRRLRDQGVMLPPAETGAEAIKRWQNKAEIHLNNAGRLAAEITVTDARIDGLRTQVGEKQEQRKTIATEISRLDTWLESVNAQAARLRLEPAITRELGDNPTADLYNSSLRSVLEKHADDCQRAFLSKTVEGAADWRIAEHCRSHPNSTFPVPIGIDLVIEKLQRAGVTSAIPAYRWLSEYCEAGEASRRLLAQPALYSGIVVQASGQLDLARTLIVAEGLELPVVVGTPADFAVTDAKVAQHVVLPEEKGFYNSALAQINLPRVVNRSSLRETEISQLISDQKATEGVLARLREFIRTYPAESVEGRRKELKTQEQLLVAQDSALRELNREVYGLTDRLKELRGKKEVQEKDAALGREQLARAQAFVSSYEGRVVARREEERDLIGKIQQLIGNENDFKGKLAILAESIPQLEAQISRAQLDQQAFAIRKESLPAQFVGPEAVQEVGNDLKTLFDAFETKRRDYEGRVQAGYYDAKIEEEQRRKGEIEAEQRRDPACPAENDIQLAMTEPDLDHAVEQQTSTIATAVIEVTTARRLSDQVERDRPPPLGQSERDTPHPDLGIPATSTQATEFSKRCDELSEDFDVEAGNADENLTLVSHRLETRNIACERYTNFPPRLRRIVGETSIATEMSAEFQGDDAKDRTVIDNLESNFDSCQADLERAQKAAARVYNENYLAVFQLRDLEGKTIDSVERIRRVPRNDLESRISFWISEIRTHGEVIAQELADFDKERRTVLALMSDCVRDAEAVLRGAESRSRMPDNMGAWSGHYFLKISTPRRNDQAERLVLLDRKLAEWIDAKNPKPIPSGAKLAYHCLIAVAGKEQIDVKILKPEYNLRPFQHDIVKLKSFSGGEQVTAAIILYCIIVKLRSQRRGRAASLMEDSGFLLLDNPLGKANLPDFIDLQISMADRMGVQYICGTGINDFDALAGFPKIIRLRNSSINPRTGANIVEVEGEMTGITSVSLNYNGNGKAAK
jgi:DNA repair exonuclease SbcCD ATPase subunit